MDSSSTTLPDVGERNESGSESPRQGTPGKSPRKGKSSKQVPKKSGMPLFGKEGEETAKLLRELRVVSDASVAGENFDGVAKAASQKLSDLHISDAMSCATCAIFFDTREEQIYHYKTDWHRFNLKQRLKGANSVTEATFTEVADNISSLSGTDFTDSETEEGNAGEAGKAATLAKLTAARQKRIQGNVSDDEDVDGVMYASEQNQLFLKAPEGQVLSLYRAILFNKKESAEDVTNLLRQIEQLPQSNVWIIIMMGGGHFAAAVFDNGEPVAHKTFHRYVVRAKAGKSQSQHDKKGGHAQSAGAQIRRHNEAMLAQEISELLQSWNSYIERSHRIFLRVATHNYPLIFGKKDKSLLNKGDVRIRMIPFPTRRATFSEVKRVFTELSTLKTHEPSKMTGLIERKKKTLNKRGPSLERKKRQGDPADELAAEGYDTGNEADVELSIHEDIIHTADDLKDHGQFVPSRAEITEERSTERKRKNKKPDKPAPEEKKMLPYQSEFYTACTVGDVEQLQTLIDTLREEIAQTTNDFNTSICLPVNRQGHTLLHIACQNSHAHLVNFLLGIGLDPSICDEKSVVPYLSTQNKNIRNQFRLYMGENPEKYDYSKAQVPGPLTKEVIAEKDAKDSERKKEINKKKKEKLKAKKAEQAVQRAEDEEQRRFLNLSDREKRALAAEKRLLNKAQTSGDTSVVLSRCYACGKDITGQVPFEYSNYVFCSPTCLKTYRTAQKGKS